MVIMVMLRNLMMPMLVARKLLLPPKLDALGTDGECLPQAAESAATTKEVEKTKRFEKMGKIFHCGQVSHKRQGSKAMEYCSITMAKVPQIHWEKGRDATP